MRALSGFFFAAIFVLILILNSSTTFVTTVSATHNNNKDDDVEDHQHNNNDVHLEDDDDDDEYISHNNKQKKTSSSKQEEEEDEETSTGSQQAIFTSCALPEYPSGQPIPSGEVVDVLVGLSNAEHTDSAQWYRAQYIIAYLLSADSSFYVQNFTGVAYNRTVHPGETATLRYRIRPDPRIEPRDYVLAIQIFYMNNMNQTFLATPYNGTVTIMDAPGSYDSQTVFSYLSLFVLFGVLAYFIGLRVWKKVSKYMRSNQKKGNSSSANATTRGNNNNKKSDEIDWSFVTEEHRTFVSATAAVHQKKKQQQGSSSASSPVASSASGSPNSTSASKKKTDAVAAKKK